MAFFYENIILNIVPFVILVLVVVSIHEWGHFIVARLCGVRVDVFSIGFGKKLLSWKKGDTEYRIALLPLGGFVKMFGAHHKEEVPENLKSQAFIHKSVYQRIAIVAAGPLINLILAIFIFAFVAMWGEPFAKPTVGDVEKNSPAYTAGFRSGDEVLAVGDQKISHWRGFEEKLSQSSHQSLPIKVLRNSKQTTFQVTVGTKDAPLESLKTIVGGIKGLTPLSLSSVVGLSSDKSQAQKLGFQNFDKIESINHVAVSFFREIDPLFKKQRSSFQVLVTNQVTKEKRTLKLRGKTSLKSLGLSSTETYISYLKRDGPAQKAGLLKNDRIVKINNKTIASWQEVSQAIVSYKDTSGPLKINVLRGKAYKELSVTPEKLSYMNEKGQEVEKTMVGISPAFFMRGPETQVIRTLNPLKALQRGAQKSYDYSITFFVGIWKLIKAQISPKNIGGMIAIGKVAKDSFQLGFIQFVNMIGILSAYLFILNILPIPLLDGGHLMFYFIEIAKGSAVSYRKIEIAHLTGFAVLISLMLFALFNDVMKFIVGW